MGSRKVPSAVPVSPRGEADRRGQAEERAQLPVSLSACLSAGAKALRTQARHQAGLVNSEALGRHRVWQSPLRAP